MIAIVCDHGGFKLKEYLKNKLTEIEWKDFGTFSEESTDYPDQAALLADSLKKGAIKTAIAICGTGIGMSIALNRYNHIRAALCHDFQTAELARKHNDANIIVLGGRILKEETAAEMVKIFLSTAFEGGRHERRVKKLQTLC